MKLSIGKENHSLPLCAYLVAFVNLITYYNNIPSIFSLLIITMFLLAVKHELQYGSKATLQAPAIFGQVVHLLWGYTKLTSLQL